MAAREKIIVFIAIIAIIYGVYNFLPDSSGKKLNVLGNNPEKNTDEIYVTIDKINKKLSDFKISNSELSVIRQADSDWNDSFIVKRNSTLEEKIINIPVPKYSGYLSIGNKIFAILDGNEYQIGEELESSSYIVEKISPVNVVIRKNNENEIIVPLEDSD